MKTSKKWPEKYRIFPSTRLLMALLTHIGVVALTNSVYSIGFVLVCMVNSTAVTQNDKALNNSLQLQLNASPCAAQSLHTDNNTHDGPFAWDRMVQSNLMAGVSWGAVILQIPTGWLLDRCGARVVFGSMQVVAMVAALLSPVAASISHWLLFGLRVIQGLFCSAGWVVMAAVCARWSPKFELGIFFPTISLGAQIGYFLSMFTSGMICSSSLGWSAIFYTQAAILALASLLWFLLYRDTPDDVGYISKAEITYIKGYRSYMPIRPEVVTHVQKDRAVPWKTIFCSTAVLAVLIGQTTDTWISYFVAQYLPAYMKEVLLLDMRTNGVLSSLPFLAQIAGRLLAGPVSDKLESVIPSTLNVKLFNTISTGVPVLALVAMALFVSCGQTALAVFLMSTSHFFFAMIVLGCYRSLVLIAPAFSGMICASGQFLGFVTGIALPYVIGEITKHGSPMEWKMALLMSSGISAVGMVVFLVWGTGKEQHWSRSPNVEFGHF